MQEPGPTPANLRLTDEEAVNMSRPEKPPTRCPWCGEMMPGDAPTCPHCHRAQEQQDLRPLGGPSVDTREARTSTPPPPPSFPPTYRPPSQEPLPPAPGQEPFGTLANIKSIARADPLFAVVLALAALGVLGSLLSGPSMGTIVSAATLWGLVTFRWWGYLLALCTAGAQALVLGLLTALALAAGHRGLGLIWALATVGVNVFVLLVLFTRRQHFD